MGELSRKASIEIKHWSNLSAKVVVLRHEFSKLQLLQQNPVNIDPKGLAAGTALSTDGAGIYSLLIYSCLDRSLIRWINRDREYD